MIVDGRKIADSIYEEITSILRARAKKPQLAVFTCAPTKETGRYLRLKMRKAHEVGIRVTVIEFDQSSTTEEVVASIKAAAERVDGVIVQLPFPVHIEIDNVLASVPSELDVDAIHYAGKETNILPPVVGAIKEISSRYNVSLSGKRVAVVGQGRLVGKPAAVWVSKEGGEVTVVDKDTENAELILQEADVIISGAGVPGLITREKIKDGVVIFDAGTSEEGGVLRGDADPACSSKCSLFTPVPGGIGPITVAVLLRNLVSLSR